MKDYWVLLRKLSIFNFIVRTIIAINPTRQYPKNHFSNIPIGAKPLIRIGFSTASGRERPV
jgi:hypothetical protein